MIKLILNKLNIHSKNDMLKFIIQAAKFAVVGLSNTAITLALQYLLMHLGMHYNFAYTIGFIVGIANSFFWNKRYVFKTNGRILPIFIRMFVLNIGIMLLGNGILYLLIDVYGVSKNIAPIINIAITLPVNFIVSKLWAYKER